MRNTYDLTPACVHAWAHGHSAHGQVGNYFFVGNTIYPYGQTFPIATIDGSNVFVTLQTYSNTTDRHISIALSAVSHKNRIDVYYVPVSSNPKTNTQFHNQNIDYWVSQMEALLMKYSANRRKRSLLHEFEMHRGRLQTFVDALQINVSERAAKLLKDPAIDAILAPLQAARSRAETKQKRQLAAVNRHFLGELARWDNHEILQVHPLGLTSHLRYLAHLRISQDKTCIETSKGIEVPIVKAERLYRLIRLILPVGLEDYQVSIVGFKIDDISPDGLWAGCHFVPMTQIDKIATSLGWA